MILSRDLYIISHDIKSRNLIGCAIERASQLKLMLLVVE